LLSTLSLFSLLPASVGFAGLNCGVADGDVPLTIELYLKGAANYTAATCIPIGVFEKYSEDVILGDLPHLVSVEERAFHQMTGNLTIDGQWARLEQIGLRAFAGIGGQGSKVSFAGPGALQSLKLLDIGVFGNFTGSLYIDATTPNLVSIGASAFDNAGKQGCVIGDAVQVTNIGYLSDDDDNPNGGSSFSGV
jgi:hypothetical protein